jgi:hypothetical protein
MALKSSSMARTADGVSTWSIWMFLRDDIAASG